jgi:23S rRNA G2445 N2-methylase RlmL
MKYDWKQVAFLYTTFKELGMPITDEVDNIFLTRQIGAKRPDFCGTNKETVARMIHLADIKPTDTILEPSCGNGNIVIPLCQSFPNNKVFYCEINTGLENEMWDKVADKSNGGFHATKVANDFLSYNASDKFDKIIMNPPYGHFAYAQHVPHAYSMLAPGGIMVALIPSVAFAIENDFRKWIAEHYCYSEQLPFDCGYGADISLFVFDKN